jgi:hypothetical protein
MQSKSDRVSLDKSSHRSPSTIGNTRYNTFMIQKFYVLPTQRMYVCVFFNVNLRTNSFCFSIAELRDRISLQQITNVNVILLFGMHMPYVREIMNDKQE